MSTNPSIAAPSIAAPLRQGTGLPWSRIVIYTLLGFFALVYLLPFLVMVLTSLKPLPEIYAGNILKLPEQWTLAPWEKAWAKPASG